MVDFKELRKILNGANMSVKHYQNGKVAVTDSRTFRGMSTSALEEAQGLVAKSIETDTKELAKKSSIELDTLDSVSKRAQTNIGVIMDCILSGKPKNADELHKPGILFLRALSESEAAVSARVLPCGLYRQLGEVCLV